MPDIVKRHAALGALLVLACAACGSRQTQGQDEMAWARDALERNQRLSIVATDPQARTFTVRSRDTGELHVVRLDQLVAGPIGSVTIAAGARAPAEAPVAPRASVDAATPPESAAVPSARADDTNTAAPASEEDRTAANGAEGAADATDTAAPAPAPSAAATTQPTPGPRAAAAASAPPGQVLASGPGYTIKASGPKGGGAGTPLLRTAGNIPLERLHDPIICQGARLLHIDNRNLQFDGDAISAADGCEIHITNSHIRARGIGVQARAANVYVENSDIEGDGGSIDAAAGAQVYAEASHFHGLTRRQQAADFHDLGGNLWN